MSRSLLSTTFLVSSFVAMPAWADLTGEDVWAQLQDTYLAYGADVAATSESRSGDTFTAAGVTMSILQEDVSVVFNLGDVDLVDQGDGSVEIVIQPETTMVVSGDFEGDGGDLNEVAVTFKTTDLVAVASGTPDVMTTTYSAQALSIIVDEIPDMPADAEFLFDFTFGAINGSSTSDRSDLVRTQSTMTAATAEYDFTVKDPSSGDNFVLDFDGQGVAIASSTVTPKDLDITDPTALYSDPDVIQDFTASMAGSSIAFSFDGEDGSGAGTLTSGPGRVQGGLADGAFSYEGGAADIALEVLASEIPVPLNVSLGGYSYALGAPIVKADDPKAFRLALGFRDVALDPFLWNLFDPGEVLPRDPATISFDISGLGRWLIDVLDPEQMESAALEVPGEVTQIGLSDLEVSVAGATLTGEGLFDIDNTDTETFDGFPRPEGQIDLRLVGANGLLDRLVQLGFVPEDQVMGARMMMGIFAVPAGDDTLTSTIEVNEQGHVLANGQRLR